MPKNIRPSFVLLSSFLICVSFSSTAFAELQSDEKQEKAAPDEENSSKSSVTDDDDSPVADDDDAPVADDDDAPVAKDNNSSATWKTTFTEESLIAHVKLSKRKIGILVAAQDKSLQWEADTAVSALEEVLQGLNNIVFRLSRKGTYDDKRLLNWAKEEEDLDALFIFRPMPVNEDAPLVMVTVYARRGHAS
ncbi:MAG: hypothetical protein GY822_03610 [Deltaproteobacteria bacterium]|nr:hypothetical protein [Deltaproteobacteria bacterium]